MVLLGIQTVEVGGKVLIVLLVGLRFVSLVSNGFIQGSVHFGTPSDSIKNANLKILTEATTGSDPLRPEVTLFDWKCGFGTPNRYDFVLKDQLSGLTGSFPV